MTSKAFRFSIEKDFEIRAAQGFEPCDTDLHSRSPCTGYLGRQPLCDCSEVLKVNRSILSEGCTNKAAALVVVDEGEVRIRIHHLVHAEFEEVIIHFA